MGENIEFNLPKNFREFRARASSILWILIGILVAAAAFTMIYTVEAQSQGVVLRFGKYVNTVDPGIQVKLPFGIDTVSIVQVRRQLKQEFTLVLLSGASWTLLM